MMVACRPLTTTALGLALLVSMAGAAFAVDLSCIGVQVASVEARLAAVPGADQQALAPVMAEIRSLAEDAQNKAQAAEGALVAVPEAQAYLASHPGQTQIQQIQGLLKVLRNGEPLDSALADHFEAQALIHDLEKRIATAGARLPSEADRRDFSRMTQEYASSRAADQFLAAAVQSDSAYGQLLSTLAVAEAATGGSDIPAGALVGRRFDTAKGLPEVKAAQAATAVMVALDGERLGNALLRGHIEEALRFKDDNGRLDPQPRQAIMRGQSRTAQKLAEQIGAELNHVNSIDRGTKIMATVAHQAAAPPRTGETPQARARKTAVEAIRAVRRVERLEIKSFVLDD